MDNHSLEAGPVDFTTNTEPIYLYSPQVIFIYSIFFFPLGIFLFGLNLYRRGGDRWLGVICLVTGVAIAPFYRWNPFEIVIALGAFKLEMQRGARVSATAFRFARWWPPLLIWLLLYCMSLGLRLWVHPHGFGF